MRQFDVYVTPGESVGVSPYVAVLTSHHVSLRLALVAPLLVGVQVIEAADVAIRFNGVEYVLSLMEMAAVRPGVLKRSIGSLSDQEDAIRRGLDRLFTGF